MIKLSDIKKRIDDIFLDEELEKNIPVKKNIFLCKWCNCEPTREIITNFQNLYEIKIYCNCEKIIRIGTGDVGKDKISAIKSWNDKNI